MPYTDSEIASMRRQTWLLDQARGVSADTVTTHGHALRMELMRATGIFARARHDPTQSVDAFYAAFTAMQTAAERLDAYLAGCEHAVERYAMAAMLAEGVRDAA